MIRKIAASAFGLLAMLEKNRPLDCARGDKVGEAPQRGFEVSYWGKKIKAKPVSIARWVNDKENPPIKLAG